GLGAAPDTEAPRGGLPRQCAWCRRAYDAEGTHGPPLAGLLAGASHGICTDCLAQLLARQRELLRTAGELGRALEVERERLSVVLAALQERAARAIERSRALKEQSA